MDGGWVRQGIRQISKIGMKYILFFFFNQNLFYWLQAKSKTQGLRSEFELLNLKQRW